MTIYVYAQEYNKIYIPKKGAVAVFRIKKSKYDRILSLYEKINSGDIIRKSDEADRFGVSERTIQRDIDDIRAFYDNNSLNIGLDKSIKYDRSQNGYILQSEKAELLSESEVLAVCKILLDSRTLVKAEMMPIIDKLLNSYAPTRCKNEISELILSEKFHYCQPHHGQAVLDRLWQLGKVIQAHHIIDVGYERLKDKSVVERRLQPVAVMASEYYFYLAAFIDDIDKAEHFSDPDDISPTIYRVDRIKSIRDTGEKFTVPYKDRFNDGEFKKRIQFMFGGKLQTLRFTYSGPAVEAILDHIPTAEIKDESDGVYTIEAETFGSGAQMWLKTQGDYVKLMND